MSDWLESPKNIYLIPTEEISFNMPWLGNHPSKEAVEAYLNPFGKNVYNGALKKRLKDAKNLYKTNPEKMIMFGHNITAEIWTGHQVTYWANHKDVKEISFFWDDPFHHKTVEFFNDFTDLWNYVKKEQTNIYPIYVYMERDGDIVLMEGRHRWMCAYLLGLKNIPCTMRVRKKSYEPDFARTLQKIKDLRLIPST